MELDSIPQAVRERLEQIGNADLLVAIVNLSGPAADVTGKVRQALATLETPPRTVVIQSPSAATGEEGPLFLLPWSVFQPDASGSISQGIFAAYVSIFAVSEKLHAKACCVIASNPESVTAQWISGLSQPVLKDGFDLVTPCYARHKFEGLINNSMVGPLLRSLYGKRLQNPMGPDVGLSSRLLQRMLLSTNGSRNATNPLASLVPAAIEGSLKICQTHVGERINPPTDWTNLSSLLALILGPVFLDMERNAAIWQRTRGSIAVETLGDPMQVSEETGTIDVSRMLESFQLGTRNLQEIWSLLLPPSSLLELKKLSRLAPDQFRMPDELWARIVYDFALGHRLRIISRDHLLRAMTPLYLGWVASYAMEVATASPYAAEERLEQLAIAYEAAKPYLVSRWRWPDRFNP